MNADTICVRRRSDLIPINQGNPGGLIHVNDRRGGGANRIFRTPRGNTMSITWILVADGSRARLFENARRDEPLHHLDNFINPAARMSGRRFTTDRPPTVDESVGCARHAIEPHTTLREKQAARFARVLTAALERGRNRHRFQRLVLVAPAKFLGALHECCDKPLRDCVTGEIGRDLVALGATEIHERVAHLLEPVVPRPEFA